MGPRSGVPHLRGSGWGVRGVSGVSWVSGFGGRVCVRGVRRFVCGGGGFGLLLARPPSLFPVPLRLLEGGEEEGPGHPVEGGAVRVFRPNGSVLPPVDTTDGAPLYPGGVGYVEDRPDDRILGTVVLLLGTLGGVGLGGGGGGGVAVAVLGGLVGLGAGTAFVGRAVVVGGGPFGPGDRPVVTLVGRLERKLSFLGGGLGGVGMRLRLGGGGVVAVVVDPPPPPLLPLAQPTPSHAPPHLLILPPRIPHLVHPSPLPRPEVARRHLDATNHARSLPIVETAQESKAQGCIPGHDAMEGPQGYFLGALSVSPGHQNGPRIRRVDHDVDNLQKKYKKM